MNTFEPKGKIALVTGANRGIGEAYVNHLVQAGAKVVYAAARNLDNLQSLIAQHPGIVKPILLDVSNAQHITSLSEQITALDILINNAGIANACNSTSADTLDIARKEMEIHYFGPLQITLRLLPLLKQSSQAAIINISSIAGISNFPALGPYSATKAALHSYTQGIRAELVNDGIRVIGVYPGPTDTRLAPGEMDKAAPAQIATATFTALADGDQDVFPDHFSKQMYAMFLEHPHKLEEIFAQQL